MRCLLIMSIAIGLVGGNAIAAEKGQFGTANEAKAMLARAVEALKADKAKALMMFNAREGTFRDRDLYVACAGPGQGDLPPRWIAYLARIAEK